MKLHVIFAACAALVSAASATQSLAGLPPPARKNIVFIAGRPSHGAGQHEHNAGVQLLAKCLEQAAGNQITIHTHLNAEWPTDQELASADTIVIYADGGKGHPALADDHLKSLAPAMERGCGLVCLHYAVEVPADQGGPEFTQWLGGYFETFWSVNPEWKADFSKLPNHPICNGVKPFSTQDEWYFHMRFRDGMEGVTPILSALAPESTVARPDGHHSSNPTVRKEVAEKVPQAVAWAATRPNNGRAFGFTGGHYHAGWGDENQRRLVLNAILWTAKANVPAAGAQSTITEDDLKANLDPKTRK